MVDYFFYTETYKGSSIPLEEWGQYEARAVEQLSRYKRAYTITSPDSDAEAMAICAMADAFAYFTEAQNGNGGMVSAASIGSVSVSYGNSAGAVDISPKGQAKELLRCAETYLDVYRGVG